VEVFVEQWDLPLIKTSHEMVVKNNKCGAKRLLKMFSNGR